MQVHIVEIFSILKKTGVCEMSIKFYKNFTKHLTQHLELIATLFILVM